MRCPWALAGLVLILPSILGAQAPEPALAWDEEAVADLAVARDPALAHAKAQLDLERRRWEAGIRDWFPQGQVQVSQDEKRSQEGPDPRTLNLGLSMNQPVWDGGRRGVQRALARAQLDLKADELERQEQGLRDQAIQALYGVLRVRALEELHRASWSLAQDDARVLAVEAERGLVTPDEVAAAEVQRAQLELSLDEARWATAQAESQLMLVLGVEALAPIKPVLDPRVEPRRVDPARVRDYGVTHSPLLAQWAYGLEIKRQEARLARDAWLPQLSLDSSMTLSGSELPFRRLSWSLGLRMGFASPWISGSTTTQYYREGQGDQSLRISQDTSPLPDPAGRWTLPEARLALELAERQDQDQKRSLATSLYHQGGQYNQAVGRWDLARRRVALAQREKDLAAVRAGLGALRRQDLLALDIKLNEAWRAWVDATEAVLVQRRQLESALDLEVGGLGPFYLGEAGGKE